MCQNLSNIFIYFVFIQLDPYDYEMIEVVLKVIERADEKITNINISQVWQINIKDLEIIFMLLFG
jgi:hypothetical protein